MTKEDVLTMDVWKERVQQDISELKNSHSHIKNEQDKIKNDVNQLQISDKLQDKEIDSLKETLSEIKEDTNWIRRKITGAFITALVTAVVAGIVGIAISKLF